jgi:tRNA(Ile)-lysidine synthase
LHPFYGKVVSAIAELAGRVAPASGDRACGLLVALSGGPDSVALLLAARVWAKRHGGVLEAAHLNHQLRGRAAQADETFCRRFCEHFGLVLHVERRDPQAEAALRRRGVEEAGRALRYRFLERVRQERGTLDCIATGHHLDDQAETVIMRMFRGAGLEGLCGIPAVSGRIIRPLLGCTREEILAFLETEGQPYCIDASNESPDNRRSRVRRELLPLARDIFGGGATQGPARMAELVAADQARLESEAQEAFARIANLGDDSRREGELPADGDEPAGDIPSRAGIPALRIDIAGLLALDRALARRVIRRLARHLLGSIRDLSLTHVDSLLAWLAEGQSGSSLDWLDGWQIVREFGQLRFLAPDRTSLLPAVGSYRILVKKGVVPLEGRGAPPPAADAPRPVTDVCGAWELVCPAKALKGQPRLRRWRDGDRIELFGLGGHKKISDLLRERRVGKTDRSAIPVVEDDLGILWVVGLARAERTRLLPDTQSTVTIQVFEVTSPS